MAAADRTAFLASHGWANADATVIAGDASQRQFERLRRRDASRPGSAVLIASAPHAADVPAFVRIAALLRQCGLSAPEVYAVDAAAGLVLVEDFGDVCLGRLVAAGADPAPHCRAAVDVLIELHRRFDSGRADLADLPRFDSALFLSQLTLFLDTYLPAALGAAPDGRIRDAFADAWRAVLPAAEAVPQSLLLRDYHLGNLMRLDGRGGVRATGLLDVQDAGLGPVTYDLVSVLEDSRLDTDACAPGLMAHYLAAFPALDPRAFAASAAVLGAVRQCRIMAVFARLASAEGKRGYLAHLPRIWRLFDRRLGDPALAPVAAWFRQFVTSERRIPAAFRDAGG